MPIFKFIGHNLTELFVKTGNWWQKHIDKRAWNNVCLQYSVLRRKHNQDIITRTFLYKSVDTSTSVTCAKFTSTSAYSIAVKNGNMINGNIIWIL